MKRLFPAPLLLCLVACQPNADSEVASGPADTPGQTTAARSASQEHIEASMVTVNGKPVAALTTKQLESQLGRPDSVAKGAVECGGQLATPDHPSGDFWYYGHTRYEVAGTKAVLASFDVTEGTFQGQLSKLPLNQKTTLEDVRRLYPEAAKQANVPATGRPGEEMSLPIYYNGAPTDASLHLIFQKGRLREVEFYGPC